jgi:hypothetical protein
LTQRKRKVTKDNKFLSPLSIKDTKKKKANLETINRKQIKKQRNKHIDYQKHITKKTNKIKLLKNENPCSEINQKTPPQNIPTLLHQKQKKTHNSNPKIKL